MASSTTLMSLAVRYDEGPTTEPGVLQCFDCPVAKCQSRTCLVVESHPQCKWHSHAPSSIGYDHHDKRLQERLGCSADQWQMVTKRVPPTHQLSRAKGVLLVLRPFSKASNCISAARQHNPHLVHQQQRGCTYPPTYNSALRDVGLVSDRRHPCGSFSHPRKRQPLCKPIVNRSWTHQLFSLFC